MITRLYSRLASAVDDEESELLKQVQADLAEAESKGNLETEQLSFMKEDDGSISVKDKETGEISNVVKGDEGYAIKGDTEDLLLEIKQTVDDIQSTLDEGKLDEDIKPIESTESESAPAPAPAPKPKRFVPACPKQVPPKLPTAVLNIDGTLLKVFILEDRGDTVLVRIKKSGDEVVVQKTDLIL